MKIRFCLLLSLVSFSSALFALSENDFAYRVDLQIDPGTPFYELVIPPVVYENISRSDMGDLRVLNGAGQVVPHGLRTIKAQETSETKTQSLPFFPLYQQGDQPISDLHLNIKRNADGEMIDIRSKPPNSRQAKRLTGYLIDLRKWEHAIDKIELKWKSSDDKRFIRKLVVSSSQDLTNWHVVSNDKTLADLSYQGHQLLENTLELSIAATNYLRLTFNDDKPGLEFGRIEVQHTQSSHNQRKYWRQTVIRAGDEPGEYMFDYRLKSSVRQLRVQLPENNTVVRVQALSRANAKQPWRQRGSALLYRLSVDGAELNRTQLTVVASSDPYWMLRVDQKGGGLGSGSPKVAMAWQPQHLVFIARGRPPYRVVWGSARVKPVLQDANELLVDVANASSGNSVTMLGQARWLSNTVQPVNQRMLEAEAEPINWRQWILWIVLIAAAALLIWMAVRLMNKMSR